MRRSVNFAVTACFPSSPPPASRTIVYSAAAGAAGAGAGAGAAAESFPLPLTPHLHARP